MTFETPSKWAPNVLVNNKIKYNITSLSFSENIKNPKKMNHILTSKKIFWCSKDIAEFILFYKKKKKNQIQLVLLITVNYFMIFK